MEKSPLSTLPPELRNTIYEKVLLSDKRLKIDGERHKQCRAPGLLQTCKQLRSEASQIYYSGNVFKVKPHGGYGNAYLQGESWYDYSDAFFTQWLASIGPESRSGLRKVLMHDDFYEPKDVGARLARCRRALKEADVEIDQAEIFVELPRAGVSKTNVSDQKWVTG